MTQQPAQTTGGNPAETYESYFVPAIFRPWTEELLRRATPRPGDRVLDLACGTGAVARQVAPLVGATGSIVGIDPSPAMLTVARGLPAPEGAAIHWREGNAEALPFPDATFDLVLCQQGLQFVADRAAAAREMRRVLTPGGRLGLSVWRGREHQSIFVAFDDAIERHLGAPEEGGPFSFGDAGDLRSLLAEAGFRDVSVEPVTRTVRLPLPDQFVRLTVLGAAAIMPEYEQMDEAARDDLVAAVRRDIADTLASHRDGDAVAFSMSAHVVVART